MILLNYATYPDIFCRGIWMSINEDVQSLLNDYWDWLKKSTYVDIINDEYTAVTTPFLDRHNDNYRIYITKKGNEYELTDDGYIISDLLMSGCDVTSGKRKEYVEEIARSYGLEVKDDELRLTSTVSEFPSKKHDFIQAMMKIEDLHYTTRNNVLNLFFEEVSNWLFDSEIPFSQGYNVRGKTYNHHIDFTLKNKAAMGPKRILQTMDKPGKDKVANLVFMKSDIEDDTEIYVMINDTDIKERNLDQVQKAITENGMTPILWEQRNEYISTLA